MTIAVRSVSAPVSCAAGGSLPAVSKPSNTAPGDFLVALHYLDRFHAAASLTGPSGWSAWGSSMGDSSHDFCKVWTLVAGASEPATYTFGNSGESIVVLICVTGQDGSSPLNVSPVANLGASSTTQSAPSVTPTVDNCLMICSYSSATGGSGLSYSPPSGMTSVFSLEPGSLLVASAAYQVLSSTAGTATGTKSATLSGSGSYTGTSMAVAPAAVLIPAPPYLLSQYNVFH